MRDTQPFVHLLKTPLGKYVYDVNTGEILNVSAEAYEILEKLQTGECAEFDDNDELQTLVRAGYLSSHRPTKIEHPMTSFLQSELDNNIEQITIQLTQQCNFRCDYCVYAVRDYDQQRTHSAKRISTERAKQAIDFLAAHSTARKDVSIGFYGGEPLLEFPLLKELILYAEEALEGKKVLFTITTNASLLHDEEASFLNEHNVNVTISLDGDREAHNRTRRYASDGSGSYDDVYRNVLNLKNNYDRLWEKLSYNAVIDPRFPCEDLYSEFDNNEIFTQGNTHTTLVNDAFAVEKIVEENLYRIQNSEYMFKAMLSAIGRYAVDRVSMVVQSNMINNVRRVMANLNSKTRSPDITAHGGPCVPGQKRLFINCDGDFYPCERVSETSEFMKIGNLDTGFDYQSADTLLNIGRLTEHECKDCWMLRICDICVQKCDNDGVLSADLKRQSCINQDYSQEYNLYEYLFMKEFSSKLLEGVK